MARNIVASALLAGAALVSAQCVIPSTAPSSTISAPFRLQVQNPARSDVHNKFVNLVGTSIDRNLHIGPVGTQAFDLTLVDGVINRIAGGIRLVIGGSTSTVDLTEQVFMTDRSDPRALFQPTWTCNPDDPSSTQLELRFTAWQDHPSGGSLCVRPSYDASHEFRYSPPGNTLVDPAAECIPITLVVRPATDGPTTTTTTTIPTATPTPDAPLYTDMRAHGYRFVGCAPEERRVEPFDFFGRTLADASLFADDMTNEKCVAYCQGAGYKFAGTEYARECWCANSYAATREPDNTVGSLDGCRFPCAGSPGQLCGGDAWLSLYEKCPVEGLCENNGFAGEECAAVVPL